MLTATVPSAIAQATAISNGTSKTFGDLNASCKNRAPEGAVVKIAETTFAAVAVRSVDVV